MGCGSSSPQYTQPRGDGKAGLYWVPTEAIHKLARSKSPGSIESKLLINQVAMFNALQVGGETLPYPPDAEHRVAASTKVELSQENSLRGHRESMMLVNQETLFQKLCGAEIEELPKSPMDNTAKLCLQDLIGPANVKKVRRRNSMMQGSIESRIVLNQHGLNSKINGSSLANLPCPSTKDDAKQASFVDSEDSDTFITTLKCKILVNQTALFNKISDPGKGVSLVKWKKMTSRAPSRRCSLAPSRRASGVDSKDSALARTRSEIAAEDLARALNELADELATEPPTPNKCEENTQNVSNISHADLATTNGAEIVSNAQAVNNGNMSIAEVTASDAKETASDAKEHESDAKEIASNSLSCDENVSKAKEHTISSKENATNATNTERNSEESFSGSEKCTGSNVEDASNAKDTVQSDASAQRRSSLPVVKEAW